MTDSQNSDEGAWSGMTTEEFANLVSDIEDLPQASCSSSTSSTRTSQKSSQLTVSTPKAKSPEVPLFSIRRGHIWVSDLSSQIWCELKFFYNFTLPVEIVPEPEHVAIGKSIHLAREIELGDQIPVRAYTKEDRLAVKLINLLTSVASFHSGVPVIREIPIFGMPFESDVFVTGIIDELRLDVNSFEIDLVELKTRMNKTLPASSTVETYRFQTMLYKELLDDLIKGKLKKNDIAKHLKLDLRRELGEDILKALGDKCCFARTLNGLLDETLNAIQTIPCPNQLFIEYCSQSDGETFHLEPIQFEEEWLSTTCRKLFEFWKGQREPAGVQVEEAWKCQYCEFRNVCEWRKNKISQVTDLQNTV